MKSEPLCNTGPKISWGDHEITGPKHLYRQRLLLNCIRRNLNPGSTVLDLGCGSGTLLLRMARKGYITHGVDLSREYTKSLSIRGGKLGVLHRPTVSLARVEETGLRSCLADGIIFSEVLEHLPDERPALNEAYRLLKSDGRLFVTVPANPDLWSRADQAAGHYRRYGKVELEKLLEESNFNDIKVWPWGTLVTRMYEKLVFIPWMSTRAERGQSPGAGGWGGQLAKMRIVSFPLSWGLSLDALFSWLPTGTGWIAVARKTGG